METNGTLTSNRRGSLYGILSFLSAVLTMASVTMIGFTSFTAFNPPDWLRITTMAPLPFLIIASVGFGIAGLKQNSGRAWAIGGLAIAFLSVAAFIVMISVGG